MNELEDAVLGVAKVGNTGPGTALTRGGVVGASKRAKASFLAGFGAGVDFTTV